MKRFLIPTFTAISALASATAWAHGGPEELGHHWEMRTYTNEMHLQIAVMAIVVCVVTVGSLIMRRLKNRSARQ